MPLVMCVIGTSSTRHAGPDALPHAARDLAVQLADAVGVRGELAAPAPSCRTARRCRRGSGGPGPGTRSRLRPSCRDVRAEVAARSARARSMSMPAGTGVCVVKTLPAATASRASAKVRLLLAPSAAGCARAPGRPSGPRSCGRPSARCPARRSARTPPMPSRISWRMRISLVAAVELRGDARGPRAGSPAMFGVEQVERHAADLHPPDLGLHRAARAARRRSCSGLPSSSRHELHRHVVEVVVRVASPAASRRRSGTGGSSPAVEQPDADQRQAQVAGRLQVVAGQHAQAAGVDRQALGQPELREK